MLSIALDSSTSRSRNRIEGSGFIRGMSCVPIFDSPVPGRSMAAALPGDSRFSPGNLAMPSSIKEQQKQQQQEQKPQSRVEEEEEEQPDSCSSSIGMNSDLSCRSSDGEDSGEVEVQSSYKGPLDAMNALEEVLPIRRGISNFYRGKSKSFASLADAAASSMRELAKPENAYSRKRKNLLAFNTLWDSRNRGSPLRSNGGGISKRTTHSSRSTLALAVAMSSSESNNSSENSNSNSSSPTRFPLPLHPQAKPAIANALLSDLSPRRNFSTWRSFSLADLQCAASTSSAISNAD